MRGTIALVALIIALALSAMSPTSCRAGMVEKVVAYIDNKAITLSGLEEAYERARSRGEEKTRMEVLEGMINKHLLLREAKRLRIEAESEEAIIAEYMNLRIIPFVRISEKTSREFYESNRESFEGVKFRDARERIEQILIQEETLRLLEEHIEKLRAGANIRIVLE